VSEFQSYKPTLHLGVAPLKEAVAGEQEVLQEQHAHGAQKHLAAEVCGLSGRPAGLTRGGSALLGAPDFRGGGRRAR